MESEAGARGSRLNHLLNKTWEVGQWNLPSPPHHHLNAVQNRQAIFAGHPLVFGAYFCRIKGAQGIHGVMCEAGIKADNEPQPILLGSAAASFNHSDFSSSDPRSHL